MFFCSIARADNTDPAQKEAAPSQQAAPQTNKTEQQAVDESVKKALQDPKSGYQFTDQTVIDMARKLAKSPMVPPPSKHQKRSQIWTMRRTGK